MRCVTRRYANAETDSASACTLTPTPLRSCADRLLSRRDTALSLSHSPRAILLHPSPPLLSVHPSSVSLSLSSSPPLSLSLSLLPVLPLAPTATPFSFSLRPSGLCHPFAPVTLLRRRFSVGFYIYCSFPASPSTPATFSPLHRLCALSSSYSSSFSFPPPSAAIRIMYQLALSFVLESHPRPYVLFAPFFLPRSAPSCFIKLCLGAFACPRSYPPSGSPKFILILSRSPRSTSVFLGLSPFPRSVPRLRASTCRRC